MRCPGPFDFDAEAAKPTMLQQRTGPLVCCVGGRVDRVKKCNNDGPVVYDGRGDQVEIRLRVFVGAGKDQERPPFATVGTMDPRALPLQSRGWCSSALTRRDQQRRIRGREVKGSPAAAFSTGLFAERTDTQTGALLPEAASSDCRSFSDCRCGPFPPAPTPPPRRALRGRQCKAR